MAADEPPYLTVGTDVSAKYKGAFCEAKIKKVNRVVKCKVTFKNNQGSLMVPDDQIRGSLRIGALVEARHPEKNQFLEAIINKMQDYSQYTVVFDDGDETTLRRTSLCLKSGRHFAESPTLDQFPLTNPEHFGTPVIGAVKSKRKRRSTYNSSTLDYSSSDEELIPKKSKVPRSRERDPDVGKVVCIDFGDRRKKDNWYPGLVVLANSSQDTFKINTKEEYLIRSFKDGKYYQVPKRDTREFSRDVSRRVENNTLRIAVDKALLYSEKGELPPHWDKALHLGTELASDDESHDTESDTSDDEPSEEKDRFVAQLYKFMDERGTPINKAPTVGSKDVNLYKLFKVVHKMGGYNRVTNQNKWKVVYVKMGFQSSNQSGSNQLKLAYKRFLHSFEDFYRKLGCTMVTNSRTTRGRHRSDRNFILTRNTVSAKTKIRGKDKSIEKKAEDKSGSTEKKETKAKTESPKSDEKVKKKVEKPKVDEKEHKPKLKKEDEKPRLVRSQSLNKEKRDNVEEKKDTRTDRARAREEMKKEKTESPEKKKETRSSAKLDSEREKREKEAPEKKPAESKETKDKSPKEKKEEKTSKEVKSSGKKDESPQKEKKIERPFRERIAKEEKTRNKSDDKPVEKEKKDKIDDSKEKKSEKIEIDIVKTEVRIFTREKKDKQDLAAKAVKEQPPKPIKEVVPHPRTIKEEKEVKSPKLKTSNEEEQSTKDKQVERRPQTGESEPDALVPEIKEEKDDGMETENTSFESRSLPSHDDDDDLHKENVKRRRNGDEKDESKSFTDLTDSEEYDDGSGSEKSEKDGKEKQIEIGDKVRVKYGRGRTRKVYEAKVLKIDSSGGEKRYYVHYAGWNMRYDEWVRRSFIVENISDRSKFARQRRQDVFNKGSLSFMKRTDRSKPPGLSSAAKLARKNSTSSTTSVSSSRTTRSDKNNSLQTSPFSKGLQPKKRARRKSGLSLALTDTSQDSESDEEDLLYLYPEGELNDEEDLESDSPGKPCDNKKESSSDHEMVKDKLDNLEKHSDVVAENSISPLELKIEKIKYETNESKSELLKAPEEPTSMPLEDDDLIKPEVSGDGKVSCESIAAENASEAVEKDLKELTVFSQKPLDTTEDISVSESKTPILYSAEPKDEADLNLQKISSDIPNPVTTDNDDFSSITTDALPMLKKMKQVDEKVEDLAIEFKGSEVKSMVGEELSAMVPEIKKADNGALSDSKPAFIPSVEVEEEKDEKIVDEKMPLLTTCVGSYDDIKPNQGILKEEPTEIKYSDISQEMPTCVPSLLKKEVVTTNKDDIPQEKNESKVAENSEKNAPICKVLDKITEASEKIEENVSKPVKSSSSSELQELVKESVPVETTPLSDNIKQEKEEFGNAGRKKKKSNSLKVFESEIGSFMDLSKPCPKLENIKSEEKVVEEKQHSLPLECSSLESKQFFQSDPEPVSKHEKDHHIVEPKCDQESKNNISELKDSHLQTSVIAFAGSSTNSPTCASAIASSDSEPFIGSNKEVSPATSDDVEMDLKSSPSLDESVYDELKPMVPEQELTPKQQLFPEKEQLYAEEDLPPSDTSFSSSAPESEEKPENLHLPSKSEEDLDDSIHESLTELSIDDASRDRSESDKVGMPISCSVSNVFLNVSGHKSSKDSEELFLPRNLTIDSLTVITKEEEESDNSEPTNLSLKFPTLSGKFSEEEKSIFRDSKESISPPGLPFSKKDGKKKKSKLMKQEKKSNLDAGEKDEVKMKEGKSKSKKKKSFDTDDLTKFKDSEQKIKAKKLKKNKNKKRFPKHDDFDFCDEDKESMGEKMKRKEKRKRDDKKFSKFDLKSDGTSIFKGEASKKERKKGRKNKLGSDKKAELGDKKTKKKKKTHIDDSIDTDSDRESLIGQSEKKKKEKKKKMKPKDTSSSDDTADGKLLIDETKGLENQEQNEDLDMSLLCEEKLPASPVNILPDGNTASSSIDDSNNASPSSDEEHGQAVNLEMYPISSSLDILSSVNHSAEACAVLDNTPPTTPSSTESIPSSSPSHDRESFVHYTESTQSGRDSVDGESDSLQCESNRTEVSESEEYRAAATLAFAVCKSVKEKPRDCTRAPLKRQKSESDDYSPSKRKRKSKRSFGTSETPTKPARVKGLSRFSKSDNCDAFDSGASAATVSSPPHSHASSLFTSFSHSSNQQMSVSSEAPSPGTTRSSKVNFYIPLHEYKDPEKRIAILQEKMSELRKVYASLKAEVATIDRRRKKARKKMREAAGSAANNSSTTHSEDAQNCS